MRQREIGYERTWLYPKQAAAIFDCVDIDGLPSRYALIEASTKAGKTTACIAWIFEQAMLGGPGKDYWWIAPVYGQAEIAFRRMKEAIVKWLYTANESKLFIRFKNGATVWFKSAEKPDNLYGEDVYAAVLDEASRMREESWHAVRSTLTATQGPIRIIGNVKGRKNWFYRMARMAEQGRSGMSYAKLNAYDAIDGGVVEKTEVEDAKAILPESVFRELYLAEASDDEGNPFGFSHITACTAPKDDPLSSEQPIAGGADLAKSIDWTVVIALDRFGATCGFERWQKTPWSATTERLKRLIKHLPFNVDSTGVGDPIVEDLQTECYSVTGYHFSSASKQRLMEGLVLAIQSHQIKFPPGPIVQELEQFEYVFTRTGVRYSAPEGFHDDCVMALALAVDKWRQVMPFSLGGSPEGIDRISPWLDNFNAPQEDSA